MGTISTSGTFTSAGANGQATKSITTVTVGDLILVHTLVNSRTVNVTGITGGGVDGSGFTRWFGPYDGNTVPSTFEIWAGRVGTVAAGTLSLTFSASVAAIFVEIDVQQFISSLGASAVWTPDAAGGAGIQNVTSTTRTFPSLTPSRANGAYTGHNSANSGTGAAGATSGYVYQPDLGGDLALYNPSVTSGVATQPTGSNGATSAVNAAAAIVFYDSAAATFNKSQAFMEMLTL